MKLSLFDSVRGNNFILENNKVFFYSCGITAQSEIHVGHCRTFIFYDFLLKIKLLLLSLNQFDTLEQNTSILFVN